MKKLLITGMSGFLGHEIEKAAGSNSWTAHGLGRRPSPPSPHLQLRLGDDVDPSVFSGVDALVHCAYDFKMTAWADIERVNVLGSRKLFAAARAAGVRKILVVSSISAFEGCQSLYGRAKLAIERAALENGATVVRPGLIWNEAGRGIFGNLVEQVRGSKVVPLIDGGKQIQYLIHVSDLSAWIIRYLDDPQDPSEVVTVAHSQPWTFREILQEIAQREQTNPRFLPVPWPAIWLPLKMLELVGIRAKFRSDSVISLINQNPAPDFQDNLYPELPRRSFSFRP